MPRAALAGRRTTARTALPGSFYDRDAEQVARGLLGAVLEHRRPDGRAAGRIVEVEAYLGPDDPACHAAVGRTRRNRNLHGPPGTAYVYFVYGMHWCVNAVTREVGYGSAVLIRALEPLSGQRLMRARRDVDNDIQLCNGPGKLCEALGIDGVLDGARLDRGPLRILPGNPIPSSRIGVSPRIGITKAADWPLRFFLADSRYVSRMPGRRVG